MTGADPALCAEAERLSKLATEASNEGQDADALALILQIHEVLNAIISAGPINVH